MLERWLKTRRILDRPTDLPIKSLLREWQGIEPRANFEASVWRRMRATATTEPLRPGPLEDLRGWLAGQPIWATALAATAGVFVGVWIALAVPASRPDRYAATPLLQPQTLTGAYLAMVSGETR
jgi:hypothetical protein